MWFSGPDLQTDEYEDNQLFPDPSYRDELKCAVTLSMTECSSNFYDELFNVTNNFIKLIRIFSFIFRFINNIKAKESCNKEKYLTAVEIKRSTEFLAKIAQLSEFKAEIDAFKKGKGVSKTSKLRALDPFLDENSLFRVGGRLSNADLPFEAKHQIIIPSKYKFTNLLFEHMHKKFFHIGAQGLVHQIRMQFWPINGKGIARKTVHDCIACFRQKPTGVDQLMGNLPSERVTPSAPFLNSGVDFCGPFQIKFKNQRKGIFSKVYVAIFVCLATKAIHLEAVTDLTTEAFIAALKRLCARRGRISTLMSDNATNFKGAAAELNRFIKLICNKNETLANYFASEAIQWKFIPPRSPNFGGLWEAGVKSFKHHLYRTSVNSKITFEEFETIIIQIEGILNSRPLVPLSDNINEYEVLTPGHLIIGRPISAIPEPAILDISDNRLSRWQYTTKCVQTLWKRWKNDYLNHLQQRNKWQFEKNNVAVGCLVLLKQNDLPPCKWAMARILEVIYGTDENLTAFPKENIPIQYQMRCYGCGIQGVIKSKCPTCNPNSSHRTDVTTNHINAYTTQTRNFRLALIDITFCGIKGRVCANTGSSHSISGERMYQVFKDKGLLFQEITLSMGLADGQQTTGTDFLSSAGLVLDVKNACLYFWDNPTHKYPFGEELDTPPIGEKMSSNTCKLREGKQADFAKPFLIRTDASNYALGAVLLQGEDKEEHPVEFASRLLNPTERNYSTTERDALAVVWALNKFRAALKGQAPLQHLTINH
ncbi:integrase catalytic domain-containing protein [Trichonephila clavipes]|nr:integrase catalytic domain-containing protein [Trichonephila clavipes]